MKLNHLNLTVTDVPETRKLFETYFGLKRVGEGVTRTSTWCDDDGAVITLHKNPVCPRGDPTKEAFTIW